MKTRTRSACFVTEKWWFSGMVLLVAVMCGACSARGGSIEAQANSSTLSLGTRLDETLDWNEHLIDALFTAGTAPPPALRDAAIMNVAMFDAANGVHRRFQPIHFDR